MSERKLEVAVSLSARDEVNLTAKLKEEVLTEVKIRAIGCYPFLQRVDRLRQTLEGQRLDQIELPQENDHSSILIRELLLKMKEEWLFPYTETELCHCRVVSTEFVDRAVVNGAFSAEDVARATSAGTGCGTCRKDTEKIIQYRLGHLER